jgi:hypothetical protein
VTTYLYGDRGSTQAIAAWKVAEATGLAIDQAILPRPARTPARLRLHDNLSTGDILVVNELGALGESYEEIVDTARELMRRKVLLRSLEDNLLFDGLAETSPEQASRDALIAYVAATTMDRKAARRAAQTRAALLVENPSEQWEERAGGLQFRVIAGQIAAFAAIVYILGLVAPGSHRREIPNVASETFQARQNRALLLPPAEDEKEDARHLMARPAPYAYATAAPSQNALGLSAQQQRLAYETVVNWRSARVRSRALDAGTGATVTRRSPLATFPHGLVAQAPSLRNYRFFVHDKRVVIVDPGTRQVVAVLKE